MYAKRSWPNPAAVARLAAVTIAAATALSQRTALAGTPVTLVVVSGNNQSSAPGSSPGLPLTVLVEDSTGHPVAGAYVTFSVTGGGGLVSPRCVQSNALGRAETTLTLGLEGTNTVAATTGALTPALFAATAHVDPAQHADYYVAQGASGASDANDGLAATFASGRHGPWSTLSKAANLAQAGDVVHVANGNYREDILLDSSGTAAAPIRFYAQKGQNPVVRSIRVYRASHVEVRGFTVVGSKVLPAGWVDMPATVIDDPTVTIDPAVAFTSGRQALVNRKYATYVNAVNNVFNGANYSLFTGGIRVTTSSHVTIANNTVSLHTIGIDLDAGSSQLTITSNDCFHCRDGIWSYASSGSSFTDSTIEGNHCHQNLSVGITAANAALRITIANNVCDYNGIHQIAVASGSASCTVRGNVARHGGYYTETMPHPGSSAYNFYNVGYGNVADGNEATDQHDPTQSDGNGFINDTSVAPVRFVNNVAYRNSGTGITFTATNGNAAINNTLVENGYQSTQPNNGAGLRFSATVTGNTIVNNVFSGNRACGIQSNGALRSQVVDFNVYAPGKPAIHDSYTAGKVVYQTALDVRNATSQEDHGQSVDPRFVNPVAADFHLATGSPAIGAGDPVRAPLTDRSGFTRTPPPSAGAFERD